MGRHLGARLPHPVPPVLPILDLGVVERCRGTTSTGEAVAATVASLAAGGARWLQLRDKRADDRDFLRRARRILALARRHGLRLVVNDRVDVALAIGADGVHVGQDDLPVDVARRLLGPERIVGVSTGDRDEARRADATPVDYLAVGPVYPTDTKEDAGAVVGIEALRRVRAAVSVPVVAIGGIDAETAGEATAAGADCVAVISALLEAGCVEAATRAVRDAALDGMRERRRG